MYDRAVESSAGLADKLSVIQLTDLEDVSKKIDPVRHFSREQTREIKGSLEKHAQAAFAESKRSQVRHRFPVCIGRERECVVVVTTRIHA